MLRVFLLAAGVVVAYLVAAGLSAAASYADADAWTVWLTGGLVLGLLLVNPGSRWTAMLAGVAVGSFVFEAMLGGTLVENVTFTLVELAAPLLAAGIVARFSPLPFRLAGPRELLILVIAGVVPLGLIGAGMVAAWHLAHGGQQALATFSIWVLSVTLGGLLVAPLIVAWSAFRPKRSGGLAMSGFVAGAVACVLFVGTIALLFFSDVGARFGGSVGAGLTYLPMLFIAPVALLWGVRGVTLAALLGALLAILGTVHGQGPFAVAEGFVGEAKLEVQGYAAAIMLMGLLLSLLADAQRVSAQIAREWRSRFETAISAHRMLAYEWDPVTGLFSVTGDAMAMLGPDAARVDGLADWIALVAFEDRERVRERFERRAAAGGDDETTGDTFSYRLTTPAGPRLASDDARAVRDHDGVLHRVVGIVRLAPGA